MHTKNTVHLNQCTLECEKGEASHLSLQITFHIQYIRNELLPESTIAELGNCALIGVILEQHDVSHSQDGLEAGW